MGTEETLSPIGDPRDYAAEHAAGGMSAWAAEDDPKRLAFTAARYKHVAKILEGKGRVLEVGCSDGFWSRIVCQHVGELHAIDADRASIMEARGKASERWPVKFMATSIDGFPGPGFHPSYDAVYTLDVLEHINPDGEFLVGLHSAAPVAVIGTPSVESQQYASEMSRLGHVNCYSGELLKKRLLEFWSHVFLFTMHDETLGTSYAPMAHYLLAVCVR
jgi:SAM-dependent methyltransferase